MAIELKYRPYLTQAELEALLECATDSDNPAAASAAKTIRVLLIKIGAELTTPAYVATGKKPGKVSLADIVRQDASFVIDGKPINTGSLSLSEAEYQANMFKSLGQPIPQHIQDILDSEKGN